jgi:hypothetical protein
MTRRSYHRLTFELCQQIRELAAEATAHQWQVFRRKSHANT